SDHLRHARSLRVRHQRPDAHPGVGDSAARLLRRWFSVGPDRSGPHLGREWRAVEGGPLTKDGPRVTGSAPAFVVVTGMSGAGKSQAVKVFEDLGYYIL